MKLATKSVDNLFSTSQIHNSSSKVKVKKICSFTTVYVHWHHLGLFQIQFQIQIPSGSLELPTYSAKHTEATCWRLKQLKVHVSSFT